MEPAWVIEGILLVMMCHDGFYVTGLSWDNFRRKYPNISFKGF